jgi:hypothetical protein
MPANNKDWIITIDSESAPGHVVAALRKRGLKEATALGEIGVVVGKGTDAAAANIRALAWVVDVTEDAVVDIGPPESPIS